MILLALFLVPFLAGVLCALARTRRVMEIANMAASGITFLLSILLAGMVLKSGPVSLLGRFLYADHLSALVCLLTASVALACSAYGIAYLRDDERSGALDRDTPASAGVNPGSNAGGNPGADAEVNSGDAGSGLFGGRGAGGGSTSQFRKYYSLTPLFVSAMFLVCLANNLGVMWVAIEFTTLASVFLVAFYGNVFSIEAAWKYAIIGGVGLSLALFGTVLTYYSGRHISGIGTLAGLNWSELALHAGQLDGTTMRLAFILVLLGYGTKAGLAPMHTWKPDAYSEAPVPVAALLATAMLNCALYGLVRFYILTSRCLGPDFPGSLLLVFGMMSMGIAVPFFLLQRNLRRLLAYSSVDQAGIMVTALGLGGKMGALALMLHMTFHTVAKSLLFLCAGNIYHQFKTDLFHKLKGGVMRVMPVTGAILLVALFAILGVPPFALFQSEFLIVQSAIASEHYVVTGLFTGFSMAIFAGALLHIGGMVLGPAREEPVAVFSPWRDLPIFGLTVVLVMLGFWLPAPLLELIQGAANVVTGD